ncbi:MAG TPA: hypothetical protein VGH28_04545 [Polyangiaceae bacterium]|jgi:hypothetical protein
MHRGTSGLWLLAGFLLVAAGLYLFTALTGRNVSVWDAAIERRLGKRNARAFAGVAGVVLGAAAIAVALHAM